MNRQRAVNQFALDQGSTIKRIVAALDHELRPMHYREAYDRFFCVSPTMDPMSKKTDGAEKVRQWFAETDRGVFVDQGYLYLRTWLTRETDQLLRHDLPAKALSAQELAACMYDTGRRHDHMMDKKGTANTPAGIENRQRCAKIEWSVAGLFQERFPEIYRDPENRTDYRNPCDHDFKLCLGDKTWKFDVKEFTRTSTTILTNVRDDVIYIFAVWRDGEHRAHIVGFITGREFHGLRDLTFRSFSAKEATIRDLAGIASLMVYLNMRLRGDDLNDIRARFNARTRMQAAA